eukprot:3049387-Pyramimonas_sp.AAC.1
MRVGWRRSNTNATRKAFPREEVHDVSPSWARERRRKHHQGGLPRLLELMILGGIGVGFLRSYFEGADGRSVRGVEG